jgi:hypothetical protein
LPVKQADYRLPDRLPAATATAIFVLVVVCVMARGIVSSAAAHRATIIVGVVTRPIINPAAPRRAAVVSQLDFAAPVDLSLTGVGNASGRQSDCRNRAQRRCPTNCHCFHLHGGQARSASKRPATKAK